MSAHDSHNMGVEPEGLNFSATIGSVIGSVVVVVLLVAAGMAFAAARFHQAKLDSTQITGYPVLHETTLNGTTKIDGYGKAENGRYTIPIERAMELEVVDASN